MQSIRPSASVRHSTSLFRSISWCGLRNKSSVGSKTTTGSCVKLWIRGSSFMKRQTAAWVRKAEEDWQGACDLAARNPPLRDLVCFHCQQTAEKYLKALLQEVGAILPKTHNLKDLVKLLLPYDGTLAPLQRGLRTLSRYAVDYRYPGLRATRKRMQSAMKQASRIRGALR